MTDVLDTRYPEVKYLLAGYVLGDGSLAGEVGEYTKAEGRPRAVAALAELQQLLVDTTLADQDLDTFTRTHSSRYLGSGRATLQRVADEIAAVLATPEAEPAEPAEPARRAEPTAEVMDRLASWLEEQGMLRPDDLQTWDWSDADGAAWIVMPPSGMDAFIVVTPDTIRAVQPAFESVPDVLRELGLHA